MLIITFTVDAVKWVIIHSLYAINARQLNPGLFNISGKNRRTIHHCLFMHSIGQLKKEKADVLGYVVSSYFPKIGAFQVCLRSNLKCQCEPADRRWGSLLTRKMKGLSLSTEERILFENCWKWAISDLFDDILSILHTVGLLQHVFPPL